MRTRRWIGWSLVILGTLLILSLTVRDFYDFIFRHNGIAFYRRHPWLLAVCLGVGVVGALGVHLIQMFASRLKQWGSEKSLKPNPLTVVIVHAVLLLVSFLILLFVVPVFGEMFASFSARLPGPTWAVLDLSAFVRRYAVISPFGLALLLWLDATAYERLYGRFGRRAGLLWFWGWVSLLVLLVPLIVFSMFMPIFRTHM